MDTYYETECIKKTLLDKDKPGNSAKCSDCKWQLYCKNKIEYCKDDFIDKDTGEIRK